MKAKAYSIGAYRSEGMLSADPEAGIYEADSSRTLDAFGGTPNRNQGSILMLEVSEGAEGGGGG